MMISVIVPCYNAQEFIHRAVESVLQQTYKNWELLLVDNNSTDGTLALLQGYQEQYPDQVKVLQEFKKGAPAARNLGLQMAKGDWIQFLDADDELFPDKLERQMSRYANTADLIIGNFNRVVRIKGITVKIAKKPYTDSVWTSLVTARLGITSANLWKKEMVVKAMGWDENLSSSQEYDLMFRMLKQGAKVAFDIEAVAANIYYENNSITRTANTEKNIRVLEEHLKLRLGVKKYLEISGQLDDDTARTIDIAMYSHLMDRKHLIPEYIAAKEKELNLDIAAVPRLRQKTKNILKSILAKLSS
jgi:glycosyltransferase involved in cell wall biosynthesis